ncbi:hypothetical protein ACN28I_19170 [Archangium gephyra]|uniref:hypothetical protein n=1 Tax=Archangium gephyra TaxID=48 RepID=UPI003B7CDC53
MRAVLCNALMPQMARKETPDMKCRTQKRDREMFWAERSAWCVTTRGWTTFMSTTMKIV